MPRLVSRLAISVGLVAALFALCLRLPHIDHATVALLLVLLNVGLAKVWGRGPAFTAAIVGGIAFEYYFLPPRGFSITDAENWVALGAFLFTAIVTGQLSARAEQRRIDAVKRRDEMEKLYRLVNALLESENSSVTLSQLAKTLLDIFSADGVALYDKHTGLIVRSGMRANVIPDEALREVVTSGHTPADPSPSFSLVPIRHGGEVTGSLGLSGGRLSEPLLNGVAGRVGLGLARLYAETEAARRSEELKSAVMDAMAHDIKNPLNSIKLATATLLTGQAESQSDRQQMLTIIDEEVNRMNRFIDEAMQLTRVEATQLSLNKEPRHMAQLIPAAVEEMGALTSGRLIQVCVPESLPPADCDEDLIRRVVKQLVGNALKYSPEGSPLTVSAKLTGGAIVIDVVDRGPGVDREERDRIFEKYYRGRAARAGTSGTGLGLASARSIVEAHGGEIWVTSAPAGGAAFHVSLPVTDKSGVKAS